MSVFRVIEVSIFSYFLRIQSECGKMLTRINPDTDTFHAVDNMHDIDKKDQILILFKT